MSGTRLPAPLDRLDPSVRISQTLRRDESLFVQDSATAGLFYLVSGTIDLKRTTATGHNIVIHRARPGDTFAEASLFTDCYHCSAIAVCEAFVVECKRLAILHLLETDNEFARSMLSRFASQIQTCRRRVELLSIRSADERILAALNDGLLIEDITSFADVIGLAPETAYRSLARLSEKGLLLKSARGHYQLPAD